MKKYMLLLPLFALGCILRLGYYYRNASLWLDESYVADNTWHNSFWGIVTHLFYGQSAPIPFFWMEQLTSVFGHNEFMLRLWPLTAGILAMYLGIRLATQLSTSLVYIYTSALIWAISEPFILYSAQAKPYSTDLLIGVFLLGFCLRAQKAGLPRYAPLVYAVAILCSFPSCLIIAGFELASLCQLKVKALSRWPSWLAAGFAVLLVYFIQAHQYLHQSFLLQFWESGFLPLNSHAPVWLAEKVAELCGFPLGLYQYLLAIPFLLYGMFRLEPFTRHFILAVTVVALAASAFHLYPFQGRVILYYAPFLILPLAAGVDGAVVCLRRWMAPDLVNRLAALFLLVLVLDSFLHVMTVIKKGPAGPLYSYSPFSKTFPLTLIIPEQDYRPLLQQVIRESRPGDGYLVHPSATPQLEAYQDELSHQLGRPVLSPDFYFMGARGVGRFNFHSGDPVYRKIQALPYRRVWLISAVSDEDLRLNLLAPRWKPVEELRAPGVSALLMQ